MISNNQTVEGRFIGISIRKLVNILDFVEKEGIAALYVSVDFEKCFDTIEFTALEGAMYYFNFGDYIIKLVVQ